jgi:hypothetical protein
LKAVNDINKYLGRRGDTLPIFQASFYGLHKTMHADFDLEVTAPLGQQCRIQPAIDDQAILVTIIVVWYSITC